MEEVLVNLQKRLLESVDEKTRQNGQHYFREKIRFYGVRVPVVNTISKDVFNEVRGRSKDELFSLCEELWKSGYLEESFIACNWSYYVCKDYEPSDMIVFDRWISNYVNNWASCDTLCNHSVGTFVEMYPEFAKSLKAWAFSENRWMKRAAAVTLIIPARKGLFLNEIFEIADILFSDQDDLVQKGYGWMLKAASEVHQQEVFGYVMKHKETMPRTALRYAIEKMPADLKARAMEK